jgi:hypothetical protein
MWVAMGKLGDRLPRGVFAPSQLVDVIRMGFSDGFSAEKTKVQRSLNVGGYGNYRAERRWATDANVEEFMESL